MPHGSIVWSNGLERVCEALIKRRIIDSAILSMVKMSIKQRQVLGRYLPFGEDLDDFGDVSPPDTP